jgi:hypothetical protein
VAEWWFRFVRSGVLDRLEELAGKVAAERGPLAAEMAVLAAAWQALLREHEHTRCGRCVLCRQGRANGAVCSVWQVAIAYFLRRQSPEDP